MSEQPFSIFEELSSWGKSLPLWQQCLLSKLVAGNALADFDIGEVFAEYLLDRNLETTVEPRKTWKISVPEVPGKGDAPSVLVKMRSLQGVNALAEGEVLEFGPQLTVVYGPNGAGKSGYARILKSACFTRSKESDILGDVKISKAKQVAPSADFVFADGSEETHIHKTQLKRLRDGFAVFDASCVRVHLDQRNTFQVMPYMFDVFPRMVDALNLVQAQLSHQITTRAQDPSQFAISESTSLLAPLLETIDASTDLAALEGHASFLEADQERIAEIDLKIIELKTSDPQDIIKKNEQKVLDIRSTQAALGKVFQALSSGLVNEIATECQKIHSLKAQSAALSAASLSGEPIQPVGTPAWRQLLEAAITFNAEAFPGDTFPPQGDGASCVLCQRVLDEDSSARLSRFFQVVSNDIEDQLTDARTQLRTLGQRVSAAKLDFFGDSSAAYRTISETSPSLSAAISGCLAGFKATKDVLESAVSNEQAVQFSVLTDDNVSEYLSHQVDSLDAQNAQLALVDPTGIISELEAERQLLSDRKHLKKHWPEIQSSVAASKWVGRATVYLRSFATVKADITKKQKDLAEKLVAKGFLAYFAANCDALELDLPVQFKFQGDLGTTDRKFEIANAAVTNIDPSQVLSEGEQTAAALADFLTEVDMSGCCAGVIFDDPVTSLDHIRKEMIARRLVQEALVRQVIVFTHDIVFTNQLATAAVNKKAQFKGQTVCRHSESGPGVVDQLAFPHSHYEGYAFKAAEAHLAAAKDLSGDAQLETLKKACGSFRVAYEDFIQQKLFNDVVGRWRENIKYLLDQVYFDEAIAIRVHERMIVLSRYVDGHSHSESYHEVPLTIELVAKEKIYFEAIKGDYKKAKKAWGEAKGLDSFA